MYTLLPTLPLFNLFSPNTATMLDMRLYHTPKIASKCKHSIHLSSALGMRQCPQCIVSAAQEGLEKSRKELEGEGGANAAVYMRDRPWNVARLRHIITKRRVERIMRKDWLRQNKERLWEEAHQQYMAEHGVLHNLGQLDCVVCAAIEQPEQLYVKPPETVTMTWWEQEGGLVVDQILVPRTPPRRLTKKKRPSRSQPKPPSELKNFISSFRNMRKTADAQREHWENRRKLDMAIRRKYDLQDEFDLDPDFLSSPLPASHARSHHQHTQDDLFASERRAKRYKRRAEGYRLSRSSLGLSELAEDIVLDEAELKNMRRAEESAELRRLTDNVATEVGYLYFVGAVGMLEKWTDDTEKSNLSLIYRQYDMDMDMRQMHESVEIGEHGGDEDENGEEL